MDLELSYIKKCFKINFKEGTLTWKKRPLNHFKNKKSQKSFNTKYAGKLTSVAASSNGYLKVKVNGKGYLVHRIIYFAYHGCMPLIVDHIDGNRAKNHYRNLRGATEAENARNKKSTNKHGFKGVSYRKRSGKFRAKIFVAGRSLELGEHKTPKRAHEAYVAAAKKHFGDFWSAGR